MCKNKLEVLNLLKHRHPHMHDMDEPQIVLNNISSRSAPQMCTFFCCLILYQILHSIFQLPTSSLHH